MTRTKAVSSVAEAVASTGSSAPSNQDSPGRVCARVAVASIVSSPKRIRRIPRARMDVTVRDAAGREVDPVAAEDPLARPWLVRQLPHDRRRRRRARRRSDASFRSRS